MSPEKDDLIRYYDEVIKEYIRQKEYIERLLKNQGKSMADLDTEAQEAAALDPFERMGDEFDEPDVPAIDLA